MSQMPEKSPNIAVDATWLNWLPIIAGALAFLLIVGYALTFRELPANANPAAWGAFGDYIGGLLNPLISLFTLIVAMKVWGLQKTELLETRKAVEEQGKTAEQQRREQRFFDLLNIYSITLDSISFTEVSEAKSVTHTGKHAFRFLVSSFRAPLSGIKHIFEQQSKWDDYLIQQSEPKNIESEWGDVSPTLEHYFRTICMVLSELELHFADNQERKRYIKLFRTQLSRDEINLIGMNLLFTQEGKRMQPYVNNSGLLKHMPPSYLRARAEKELDSRSFGDKWANITKLPLND